MTAVTLWRSSVEMSQMAYSKPTPSNLKARYAAFAAVADGTVQYWLTDAERFVDQSWADGDYAPALIAKAADNMVRNRVAGIVQDAAAMIPAGVTSFRSASFSGSVTDAAANRSLTGATLYGDDFAQLQRRNFAGPFLVGCA